MKIIRTIINWFFRRKDARSSEKQMNKIMSEINSDFMDYDGMETMVDFHHKIIMTRIEALKVVLKFLEKYLEKNIDMELQIAYDTLNDYLKKTY